jgi:LPS-assembly protein
MKMIQDDKVSYLKSELKYNFNDSNNISFSTRENKEKDLTEYYNLIYQYKNDCLAASIEYNKDYYDDRDIKPEENIFLKLTIMPFGQIASSPT